MRQPRQGILIASGALALAAASAFLAVTLVRLGWPRIASLLLAVTFGGPALLLLPRPDDLPRWARLVDRALLALTAGFLAVGVSSFVGSGRFLEAGHVLFTLGWAGFVAAALLHRRRDLHLPGLGLAVLLGILPFTRTPIGLAAFAAQAALLVGISGVRVSLRALVVASFAAILVLVVGLAGATLAFGRVYPPSLSLDEAATVGFVVPLLCLVAITFLATLAWSTAREGAASQNGSGGAGAP